jgi:uncharacterized protein YeaO (DUF488 family)
MIHVKRVYDLPEEADGARLLVDRLWPRGLRRDRLQLIDWLKDVAPSNELRRWFHHNPENWEAFCRQYATELDAHPETWQPLLEMARQGEVTLLYSARDAHHNNAVALKAYLERKLAEEETSCGP